MNKRMKNENENSVFIYSSSLLMESRVKSLQSTELNAVYWLVLDLKQWEDDKGGEAEEGGAAGDVDGKLVQDTGVEA